MVGHTELLPTFNATLNAASAILLTTGYACIRRGNRRAHQYCMVGAFAVSIVFLCSYLYLHYNVGATRFTGTGWVRPVYFAVLATHTVLAAAIVPLVLVTLYRAVKGRFDQHRRIARWTLPLWIYVSVTGVLIYFMLYQWYAPEKAAFGALAGVP